MIGVLFIARMGSTRLRDKHFEKSADREMMYWLISRFVHVFKESIGCNEVKLVICTSDRPENAAFKHFSSIFPVEVFQGNDGNVPKRLADCAAHYKFSHIISIDGDDILCSPSAAQMLQSSMIQFPWSDIYKTTGLPLGMNSWGFRTEYLAHTMQSHNEEMLETGWGRIFETEKIQTVAYHEPPEHKSWRFTLDYPEDFAFFNSIISHFGENSTTVEDEKIWELVAGQSLDKHNSSLTDEYMANFNRQIEIENN